MHEQSSLGARSVYKKPVYDQDQIGRVTSTKDYKKYGKIEVIFLDYSQPAPVWVVGAIDREPVEGDQVMVGFMQGRPDAPYLKGFVQNESYTSNFIRVGKESITLQLPIDLEDVKDHLPDDKKSQRNFIEVTLTGAVLSIAGLQLSVGANGIIALGGSAGVARIGDTVQVDVPTHGTCTGTITSGSSIVQAG